MVHPLRFLLPAVLLSAVAAASCKTSQPSTASGNMAALRQSSGTRELTADQQVQHVLNRLAFGPRPGDAQKVRAIGVDAWIAQQLKPDRIADPAVDAVVDSMKVLEMASADLIAKYPPPGVAIRRLTQARGGNLSRQDSMRVRQMNREAMMLLGQVANAKIVRAVGSERQLLEVMVDFWENHFNVFAGKDRLRYFLPEYTQHAIRPHALGTFRELLGAVARSPAMLYYLDNWQSSADSGQPILMPNGRVSTVRPRMAQAARRRGLNENYARELMELHTLGVDGGYTQQDVIEVARALTGWTIADGPNGGGFMFRPVMHDAGEKQILGKRFPAGRGIEDGEAVLDLLATHPSTARFISFKLARRFVSDSPPNELVERATNVFMRTDGDLREVVRTIVTSPEFFAQSAFRAKVKTPFELVVSTLRAMDAPPVETPALAQFVSRLGQPLYGHQAPNGYPETGDAWMNTGAILNRINFGLAAASGRVPGLRLNQWPHARELAPLSREQQVDGVVRELLGGYVSNDTRAVLLSGTNPLLPAQDSTTAVAGMRGDMRNNGARGFAQVVGLALGAPEFQRR